MTDLSLVRMLNLGVSSRRVTTLLHCPTGLRKSAISPRRTDIVAMFNYFGLRRAFVQRY